MKTAEMLGTCCRQEAGAPLLKTISFAVVHFIIAFTVAYLLTGSIVTGGLIALIEPACNTVAYYFHERFWLHFGATDAPVKGAGHGQLVPKCADSKTGSDQQCSLRASLK
jgi:uncharacterized membrane protein